MIDHRPPVDIGDIVLSQFPYSDLSGHEPRPVLVVGRAQPPDVLVAFITSQLGSAVSPAAHVLNLDDPEFTASGLRLSSVIRLDKVATLHRNLLRRRLGHIGPATQQAVGRCLRYVFEL